MNTQNPPFYDLKDFTYFDHWQGMSSDKRRNVIIIYARKIERRSRKLEMPIRYQHSKVALMCTTEVNQRQLVTA